MQLPSLDLLREQAYLVSRGVRPLAIAATGDSTSLLNIATRVESAASDLDVVPFVIDEGDGISCCGYASHAWAVDLYSWCVRTAIPDDQRSRIVGLLLGYGPEAVARFQDLRSGRLFRVDSASASSPLAESASS